jgi:hypothetical protein
MIHLDNSMGVLYDTLPKRTVPHHKCCGPQLQIQVQMCETTRCLGLVSKSPISGLQILGCKHMLNGGRVVRGGGRVVRGGARDGVGR